MSGAKFGEFGGGSTPRHPPLPNPVEGRAAPRHPAPLGSGMERALDGRIVRLEIAISQLVKRIGEVEVV